MATGEQQGAASDARLRRYVGAWVVLALVVGATTSVVEVAGVTDRPAELPLTIALVAAAALLGLVHVSVPLRGAREATTLTELAYLPMMVLLPPPVAVTAAVVSALVSEPVITRGVPRKFLFNVAWVTVGVGAGSWLFHLASPQRFESSPGPLALALVAGAVLVLVNLVALSGIVSILGHQRWSRALLTETASSVVVNFGTAAIGVLVAALIEEAPMALPILVVPVLLQASGLRARSVGHERLALERSRFERTVQGSSDGIVLLGPDRLIEVWNPRMVELTGVSAARALGRTLSDVDCAQLSTPEPADGSHRMTLGERVVDVRAASIPGSAPDERVISIRDVSQEAELARIREDLVMRVSHEIRTPLTTLSGFVETLQARWDTLEEEQRLALVEAARRGSRRLSHLVTNLMVWARIEAVTKPTSEGADVRSTVLEVVGELPVAAPVQVEAGEALTVAMAPADLYLLVANLVENAVLYGRPPVLVAAKSDGAGQVELSVSDAGEGLPEDRVPALYEPFEQQSEGLMRTAKGLGMGLTVVRALATEVGGNLRYEPPPAGGARFVVTLPAAGAGSG